MSYCVRKTMVDAIKKNATSYVISNDMSRITVPSEKFNKGRVDQIINKLYERGMKLFGKFGNSLSMDKRDPYNPAILIHPTKQLIDAYEEKEARKKQETLTKKLDEEDIKRKEEGNWEMDDEGNIIPYYQSENQDLFLHLSSELDDKLGFENPVTNPNPTIEDIINKTIVSKADIDKKKLDC